MAEIDDLLEDLKKAKAAMADFADGSKDLSGFFGTLAKELKSLPENLKNAAALEEAMLNDAKLLNKVHRDTNLLLDTTANKFLATAVDNMKKQGKSALEVKNTQEDIKFLQRDDYILP